MTRSLPQVTPQLDRINKHLYDVADESERLYNFLIDPDLAAALKLVKERDGVPESVQIRMALREWLKIRAH